MNVGCTNDHQKHDVYSLRYMIYGGFIDTTKNMFMCFKVSHSLNR